MKFSFPVPFLFLGSAFAHHVTQLGDSPVPINSAPRTPQRVGFQSGLGGLCGYVKNSVGHYFCNPGLTCEGFESGGWAYGTCQPLILYNSDQNFGHSYLPAHVLPRKKPHGMGASILRGTTDADFASLDSRHPYAWVVGPLAVQKMLSMSGREQMDFVGWPMDFVDKCLCELGQKFKILKFDFKVIPFATRADWDGLVYALTNGDKASEASKRCAEKVAPHLPMMKKHPWKSFIGLYGDPRKLSTAEQSKYNSFENFANSGETGAFAARAFLYYTMDADELYAGDGWTYDAKHVKGGDEYLTTPMLLRNIQGHTLTDMDVHCPHGQAPH